MAEASSSDADAHTPKAEPRRRSLLAFLALASLDEDRGKQGKSELQLTKELAEEAEAGKLNMKLVL